MGSVLGRRLVDAEGTEGDAAASPSRAPEQRDLQSCLDDAGKAVVEELRSANIEDIKEAITIYEDLGYDVHLGRVEFVEVFGIIFTDADDAFDVFNVDGMASMYEVAAASLLLCAHDESQPPEFDWKLRHIYDTFDLDGSMDMSLDELSIMLRAAADGLACTCGRARPEQVDIDALVEAAFRTLHMDREAGLTYDDVVTWVVGSDDIARYLEVYSQGVLCIPGRTASWHDEVVQEVVERFNALRGDSDRAPVAATQDMVAEVMAKHGLDPDVTRRVCADLGTHLQTVELKAHFGAVTKELFFVCIAPAVAYVIVTPTIGDRAWTLNDMKLILWVIVKREPLRKTVAQVLKNLGSNYSCRHWLVTHTTRSNGVKAIIFSHVRVVFDTFDINGDGVVSLEEIKETMWRLLGQNRSRVNEGIAHAICDDLAVELFTAMDTDADGVVTWEEFIERSEMVQRRFVETRNALVAEDTAKVEANHRGGMLIMDDPTAQHILGMVIDHSDAIAARTPKARLGAAAFEGLDEEEGPQEAGASGAGEAAPASGDAAPGAVGGGGAGAGDAAAEGASPPDSAAPGSDAAGKGESGAAAEAAAGAGGKAAKGKGKADAAGAGKGKAKAGAGAAAGGKKAEKGAEAAKAPTGGAATARKAGATTKR